MLPGAYHFPAPLTDCSRESSGAPFACSVRRFDSPRSFFAPKTNNRVTTLGANIFNMLDTQLRFYPSFDWNRCLLPHTLSNRRQRPMASEFPGQHASASTPVPTRQESSVESSLPDSSNTVGPRQDAVASYTTTQIGGSASYPPIFPSQSQQPEIRVAQPSPSDLERGMGDLPSDAHSPEGADFPFVPLRQPASILLPPESVPVIYGGASSGYDGFPAEGRYPHMRRQGHFSSSQDGSPPRQLHPTLPRVGSQSKSPVERFSSSGMNVKYTLAPMTNACSRVPSASSSRFWNDLER